MQTTHPEAARVRPQLTEAALCAWVGAATPGERLVYHRGFLAIDIGPESRWLAMSDRRELRHIAGRAWQLGQQGLVHLVQHREADGDYTYFVVARRRPITVGGALQLVLQAAGLAEPGAAAERRVSPSQRSA